MSATRIDGLYFIRRTPGQDWEPAEWNDGAWMVLGVAEPFCEDDVHEVGLPVRLPVG